MVCSELLGFRFDVLASSFDSHNDTVLCPFEMLGKNKLVPFTRRFDSSLTDVMDQKIIRGIKLGNKLTSPCFGGRHQRIPGFREPKRQDQPLDNI